jgi:hypothetical protein
MLLSAAAAAARETSQLLWLTAAKAAAMAFGQVPSYPESFAAPVTGALLTRLPCNGIS